MRMSRLCRCDAGARKARAVDQRSPYAVVVWCSMKPVGVGEESGEASEDDVGDEV